MDAREELRGRNWPALDQGHVVLMDWSGSDASICDDARQEVTSSCRDPAKDRTLLRFLMRRCEMSPFEQSAVKFHLRLPVVVVWHLIRYRTAHVQVYSGRYREMIDAMMRVGPDQWRRQAEGNHQGSGGPLAETWPPGHDHSAATSSPGQYLTLCQQGLQEEILEVYRERLAFGVAREQARLEIPFSNYTEMVWRIDLRNLLHVIEERWPDQPPWRSAPQEETACYGRIFGEVVAALFPATWEAFLDYRLGAMALSRLEVEALRRCMARDDGTVPDRPSVILDLFPNAREREECLAKLNGVLGIP